MENEIRKGNQLKCALTPVEHYKMSKCTKDRNETRPQKQTLEQKIQILKNKYT